MPVSACDQRRLAVVDVAGGADDVRRQPGIRRGRFRIHTANVSHGLVVRVRADGDRSYAVA